MPDLAANAITAWTTEYLGLAEQLRDQGRHVDDTLLAHLSPAQSNTIGLIGTITVDIDHELAQLDPTGHRSLRATREPTDPRVGKAALHDVLTTWLARLSDDGAVHLVVVQRVLGADSLQRWLGGR